MTDTMKTLIYAASEGPLSRAQAEMAFEELFEGTATPAQMGGTCNSADLSIATLTTCSCSICPRLIRAATTTT